MTDIFGWLFVGEFAVSNGLFDSILKKLIKNFITIGHCHILTITDAIQVSNKTWVQDKKS